MSKSKIRKTVEAAKEKAPSRTFLPNTWIKCVRGNMWSSKVRVDESYLFLGWIVNHSEFGDNAILMDKRGVFTDDIKEDDFEVL
jgi:hypothetical protein